MRSRIPSIIPHPTGGTGAQNARPVQFNHGGLLSGLVRSRQRRVDRGRGLAVVLAEQVRIYSQGDVRLAVPQALVDGNDVHWPSLGLRHDVRLSRGSMDRRRESHPRLCRRRRRFRRREGGLSSSMPAMAGG